MSCLRKSKVKDSAADDSESNKKNSNDADCPPPKKSNRRKGCCKTERRNNRPNKSSESSSVHSKQSDSEDKWAARSSDASSIYSKESDSEEKRSDRSSEAFSVPSKQSDSEDKQFDRFNSNVSMKGSRSDSNIDSESEKEYVVDQPAGNIHDDDDDYRNVDEGEVAIDEYITPQSEGEREPEFKLDESCVVCLNKMTNPNWLVKCSDVCGRYFHYWCMELEETDMKALSANPNLKWICSRDDCSAEAEISILDVKEITIALESVMPAFQDVTDLHCEIRDILRNIFDGMKDIKRELVKIKANKSQVRGIGFGGHERVV